MPSGAQTVEVKQKPAMYSYVANWQIPRAHWAEMDAANSADKAILDKAMADGTIVGYGNDINLVHTTDGWTHDDWWSSNVNGGVGKGAGPVTSSGNVHHQYSAAPPSTTMRFL